MVNLLVGELPLRSYMLTNDFGVKVAIHRDPMDTSDVYYSIWGELITEPVHYKFVSIQDVQDVHKLSDPELAILLLKNYFQ